jgi:hypothetical protein
MIRCKDRCLQEAAGLKQSFPGSFSVSNLLSESHLYVQQKISASTQAPDGELVFQHRPVAVSRFY